MNYKLLTASHYQPKLVREIDAASRTIMLATMTLQSGPRMIEVFQSLERASRRGVKVTLRLDVYSNLTSPLMLNARRRLLEHLRASGIEVQHVGSFHANPFAGRYHYKAAIIDSTVFSFGGINLKERALDSADFMVCIEDHGLAKFFQGLIKNNPPTNAQKEFGKLGTVLYDAGLRGESVIYETALNLAHKARQVIFISRMAPGGQLAHVLNNTSSTCYYNTLRTAGPATKVAQLIDNLGDKTTNMYRGSRYVHAKCMLFVMPNGERYSLTGSHNFNYRGVAYGTKEVALLSTDKVLWRQLVNFIQSEFSAKLDKSFTG